MCHNIGSNWKCVIIWDLIEIVRCKRTQEMPEIHGNNQWTGVYYKLECFAMSMHGWWRKCESMKKNVTSSITASDSLWMCSEIYPLLKVMVPLKMIKNGLRIIILIFEDRNLRASHQQLQKISFPTKQLFLHIWLIYKIIVHYVLLSENPAIDPDYSVQNLIN